MTSPSGVFRSMMRPDGETRRVSISLPDHWVEKVAPDRPAVMFAVVEVQEPGDTSCDVPGEV